MKNSVCHLLYISLLNLSHLRSVVKSFDFDSERLVYQAGPIKEKINHSYYFLREKFMYVTG